MSKTRNKFSHRLLAQLTRWAMDLIGALPLGFSHAVGNFLGNLSWLFKDRGAKTTLDNLQMCFPEIGKVQRAQVAKESLCETYKIAGETFMVWQRGNKWVYKKTVAIYGDELVKEPLARGEGVLIAAPHFGNWEFFGAHLPAYATSTCMYQPPKKTWLEDLVKEKRQSVGMILVPTNARGVAAQLKALKAGEIVAILPDQVPADESGIFSSFFGIPTYTMTLIHGFVQRTNCKVVMGVAKRVGTNFEVHFIKPDDGVYSEDQQQAVDGLNRSIEKCVKLSMTQYQWEYKRFKRQPDGRNPYSA